MNVSAHTQSLRSETWLAGYLAFFTAIMSHYHMVSLLVIDVPQLNGGDQCQSMRGLSHSLDENTLAYGCPLSMKISTKTSWDPPIPLEGAALG